MITIYQRQTDRQTDRQTTCDGNTALCTKVHRAVKMHQLWNGRPIARNYLYLLDTWSWWAQQQKLSCAHIWPVFVESVLEWIRGLCFNYVLWQPTSSNCYRFGHWRMFSGRFWHILGVVTYTVIECPLRLYTSGAVGKTSGCRHVPSLSVLSYTFQLEIKLYA